MSETEGSAMGSGGLCSSPSSPCKNLFICIIVRETMSISDQTSELLKMTV